MPRSGETDYYFGTRVRCQTCDVDFTIEKFSVEHPCLVGQKERDIAYCSANSNFCKVPATLPLHLAAMPRVGSEFGLVGTEPPDVLCKTQICIYGGGSTKISPHCRASCVARKRTTRSRGALKRLPTITGKPYQTYLSFPPVPIVVLSRTTCSICDEARFTGNTFGLVERVIGDGGLRLT